MEEDIEDDIEEPIDDEELDVDTDDDELDDLSIINEEDIEKCITNYPSEVLFDW